MLHGFKTWHNTKLGLLVFALIELGLVYAFASLAIDRGNLVYYGLIVLCLMGAMQNSALLIRKIRHGRQG